MEIIVAIVAFAASMLTLFSGFGLGTILTPVFGIFFPLNLAVALTGIVHLLNNLFKLSLLGRHASRKLVFQFGFPSVMGGILGAAVLTSLTQLPTLFTWHCFGKTLSVTPLKLSISILMIVFALLEAVPLLKNLKFAQKHLFAGGLLSGFFGGLSGHQGALRSAFLVNCGLSKEAFVATGVVIACLVDVARMPVYIFRFTSENLLNQWPVLLVATLSAFLGAYFGRRFLKKATLPAIHRLTATMIITLALLLGMGIL